VWFYASLRFNGIPCLFIRRAIKILMLKKVHKMKKVDGRALVGGSASLSSGYSRHSFTVVGYTTLASPPFFK